MTLLNSAQLIDFLWNKKPQIEQWFLKYPHDLYHFYNSVDIRRSEYKIAPVDNNIFPAGFNNLDTSEIELAKTYASNYINSKFPGAKKVLLFTESHSRNLNYIDNIVNLSKILSSFDLTISHSEITEDTIITGNVLGPVSYKKVNNFNDFDVIISNNDFSNGIPESLSNLPNIIPASEFGWFNRSKSNHFETYKAVAKEFAGDFDFNFQMISTSVKSCGCVNFKEKAGLDCVFKYSQELIAELKQEYTASNITDLPFLFIKADKGTYGMGVMSLQDPSEIFDINKDIRKKMATLKEGVKNTAVIIQEGIPTTLQYNELSAEGMVYLVAGKPVSTFLRVNEKKDASSNLNSSGMFFSKTGLTDQEKYAYEVIARLSCIAAFREKIS